MGKHRHTKDRLFVTQTEHQTEWGGKKAPAQAPLPRLAFGFCPLSLQPYTDPVCTPEGSVFDVLSVVPFVKRFGKNPVTGSPLRLDQLFKLTMMKDQDDNYICPISKKVLTDSTKVVAIRASGMVYAASTVEELNKKPKFFCDLMTGQKFSPAEIIVIQDPMDVKSRMMENFDYVRNNLQVNDDDSEAEEDNQPNVDHTALGKRILSMAEEKSKVYAMEQAAKAAAVPKRVFVPLDQEISVEDFIAERRELKDWRHEKEGTGRLASSVTSSYMKLSTSEEKRPMTELEMLQHIWMEVKKNHGKGYAQIITNIGEMNVLLFTDQAARTCFSFMDLAYKSKFKGLKFRSLIPGTLLSVGSNAITDKTMFETLDKSEKLLHKRPGLLTVNTMGSLSTFGFTLSESEVLDRTNTIFGEIKHNFNLIDLVDASGVAEGQPKVSECITFRRSSR
jgi:peptidyl-prolyl cis-trans isomerase-like 2